MSTRSDISSLKHDAQALKRNAHRREPDDALGVQEDIAKALERTAKILADLQQQIIILQGRVRRD